METYRPVKIGFVSHASDLYGAPRSLLLLLEELNREKYRPFVICPNQGPLVNKIEDLGIRVLVVPRGAPGSHRAGISVGGRIVNRLKHISEFVRILRKEQPTMVYVNTVAHVSPIVAAWLCKLPIIVHVREGRSFFSGVKRKIRTVPITHFPKRFVAVSQAVKKMLIGQGVPQRKISVVYNGVDLEAFKTRINEREVCRKELGLSNTDTLIGTVGQIIPRKGILYFVDAANVVKKKIRRGVKFIIVGGNPEPEYFAIVNNTIKRYGLSDHFILTGFRESVRRYLAAIDIFVNPTLEEPFARVNLEAMAMARPIVATNVDGNPEAIVHGKTGFLVPPGDPPRLAERIVELALNERLRQRFGESARKRVESKFTSNAYSKNVQSIIGNFVDRSMGRWNAIR